MSEDGLEGDVPTVMKDPQQCQEVAGGKDGRESVVERDWEGRIKTNLQFSKYGSFFMDVFLSLSQGSLYFTDVSLLCPRPSMWDNGLHGRSPLTTDQAGRVMQRP